MNSKYPVIVVYLHCIKERNVFTDKSDNSFPTLWPARPTEFIVCHEPHFDCIHFRRALSAARRFSWWLSCLAVKSAHHLLHLSRLYSMRSASVMYYNVYLRSLPKDSICSSRPSFDILHPRVHLVQYNIDADLKKNIRQEPSTVALMWN